jgi:hypothetical protein
MPNFTNAEAGDPYRVTASGALPVQDGTLLGIIVAASSSGTLTVADKPNNAARTLVNAIPLTAGQFVPCKFRFLGGLTLTVGGTLDCVLVIA